MCSLAARGKMRSVRPRVTTARLTGAASTRPEWNPYQSRANRATPWDRREGDSVAGVSIWLIRLSAWKLVACAADTVPASLDLVKKRTGRRRRGVRFMKKLVASSPGSRLPAVIFLALPSSFTPYQIISLALRVGLWSGTFSPGSSFPPADPQTRLGRHWDEPLSSAQCHLRQ